MRREDSVLPRADLSSALAYLGDMFGAGAVHDGAALIGGIVYQPYYLGTVILAALAEDEHVGVA